MEEKVLATIKKYNMIERNQKVVVALSGGPDSVCLLHVLYRLKKALGISLCVAHLNHKFRGKESEEDSKFVEKLAGDFNLPCFVEEYNVPKFIEESGLSPEEAARKIRYGFLKKIFDKVRADKIALGHNLNDQVETVIMRFLRGTGVRGLAGIPPVRGIYIRPLIEITRDEIMEFIDKNDLKYRIDRTNLKPIYERNKIRLKLIPLLEKEYNPKLKESISNMSGLMRIENDFMEQVASEKFGKVVKRINSHKVWISFKAFNNLHPALRYRILRLCLDSVLKGIKDISYKHIKQIDEFCNCGKTGGFIALPQGVKVQKSYRGFFVFKGDLVERKNFYYEFVPGQTVFVKEIGKKIASQVVDVDKIKTPFQQDPCVAFVDLSVIKSSKLIIRNRQQGDRFHPLGMKGTKKIKDFFIDEKIPAHERDRIPLVVDGNTIVWVAGFRLNEDYRVTSKTKKVLKLIMIE